VRRRSSIKFTPSFADLLNDPRTSRAGFVRLRARGPTQDIGRLQPPAIDSPVG